MITKLKYKKISNTLPMAECWWCSSPTNYALYGTKEDYFEVWCCDKCYEKHGKIIRRSNNIPTQQKEMIFFAKTKGENDENPVLKVGMCP